MFIHQEYGNAKQTTLYRPSINQAQGGMAAGDTTTGINCKRLKMKWDNYARVRMPATNNLTNKEAEVEEEKEEEDRV